MKLLFFLFPKDERSIWLELNILLIFFPKNSKIRVWARLRLNFNTQKSNFERNCMEIIVHNKHSLKSFIHDTIFNFWIFLSQIIACYFFWHHVSVATLLREVFYWIDAYALLFVQTLIVGVWTQFTDMPIKFQLIINTIPNNSILLVSQILSSPLFFTVFSHLSLRIKSWYFSVFSFK